MPPNPRLPTGVEGRIIAACDGQSLTGSEVAKAAAVCRDGIYTFLGRMADAGFITRVGLQYRATVLGRAALKRKEAIDALRAQPLEFEPEPEPELETGT